MPFKLEGTNRIDDTPLHKALREALANALIHADYYDRRGLVIQKWPDKIRIANPGAFRINVQEALVGGVSDPRNESLIKMFNLINVGERAGSGLPSIRTVWQKQGWQEPEIAESFNPDRTTLVLPFAANNVAAKSGGKKRRKVQFYLREEKERHSSIFDRHTGSRQPPNYRCHRSASFPHKDVFVRTGCQRSDCCGG